MDFSSLVGELYDLLTVVDAWASIGGRLPVPVTAPRVMSLPGEPEGQPGGELTDFRVAVVRHPPGTAEIVATELGRLVLEVARAPLHVEPGYWLAPASVPAPSGPGSWQVAWNADRLAALRAFPRPALPAAVAGSAAVEVWPRPMRVLLVDTGDQRSAEQEAFLLSRAVGSVETPPCDWHGHGTALGDVVRLRAPGAVVTSVRVFEPGQKYSASPALLTGLNYAVNHDASGAHVVGIAQRAVITKSVAMLADGVSHILRRAVERGNRSPVVVCAAGNCSDGPFMELPATAPGVLVVRAVDWTGQRLDYNCDPPSGHDPVVADAYGGEQGDLFGEACAADGRRIRMYGTSYAAALVVGALAAV